LFIARVFLPHFPIALVTSVITGGEAARQEEARPITLTRNTSQLARPSTATHPTSAACRRCRACSCRRRCRAPWPTGEAFSASLPTTGHTERGGRLGRRDSATTGVGGAPLSRTAPSASRGPPPRRGWHTEALMRQPRSQPRLRCPPHAFR